MRVNEAAAYLGLDRATVYRLVRQKRVGHYRLGAGSGKVVFRQSDLEAYVASCRVEAGGPADADAGSPAAGGLRHLRLPARPRPRPRRA